METICTNLSSKQDLLMKSLNEFYKNVEKIHTIIPILDGSSPISLRIIDWFVTNYSKKKNISYIIKKKKIVNNTEAEVNEQFIVYLNYKNQLKAYSKKQFDPFCRRSRIQYLYDNENYLITTVGQLNFFRWTIENNILDFITDNIKIIEHDMNQNIKVNYKNKSLTKTKNKLKNNTTNIKKTERKKRRELSVSATKFINKHKYNVTLDFN
jgi:hypothetical protein